MIYLSFSATDVNFSVHPGVLKVSEHNIIEGCDGFGNKSEGHSGKTETRFHFRKFLYLAKLREIQIIGG